MRGGMFAGWERWGISELAADGVSRSRECEVSQGRCEETDKAAKDERASTQVAASAQSQDI